MFVTWLVAESITATAFESVVVTKSCGLLAVVLVPTTGTSAEQARASAMRRKPRRKVRQSIEFLIEGVLEGFRFMAFLLSEFFVFTPSKRKSRAELQRSARSRRKLGRNSRFRALRQRGIEVKGYRGPRRFVQSSMHHHPPMKT